MSSFFLFSIRPEYAEAIFAKKKKYELRRGRGQGLEIGATAIVYVSGNVKEIRGEFTIGKIIRGSPEKIWKIVRKREENGITPESWKYIAGSRSAIAIQILNPRLYVRPISLREIRYVIPNWAPPLGYAKLEPGDPVFRLFIKNVRELSI